MDVPQIIVAKSLAVAYNNGTRSSGAQPLSTTGKIKVDNRSSKDRTGASNLSGGFDRPDGIRELAGYMWAWGDCPPIFTNDLFDVVFTMDGVRAVQIVGSGNTGVRCRGIEVVVEPYSKGKKNLVYYIVNTGGAGNDFTDAGLVTGIASLPDTTAPTFLNTKSLGVQFAYWNPSTHALVWSKPCYHTHMRLTIDAAADADWSSCLNGIAYFPEGTIDWRLQLGQRTNRWPIPVSPNAGLPYMLTSQPAPSDPSTNPGSMNTSGDLVYPDLDSVVGVRMATQVNSDLSFNSYWQLLYGKLAAKIGEFDHDSLDPMEVAYVFEKCGSPPSKTADTGYDVGSIAYVTGQTGGGGTGGSTTTFWPS